MCLHFPAMSVPSGDESINLSWGPICSLQNRDRKVLSKAVDVIKFTVCCEVVCSWIRISDRACRYIVLPLYRAVTRKIRGCDQKIRNFGQVLGATATS